MSYGPMGSGGDDAAVAEFEHICASRIRPGDLEAIKSKLHLK